MTNLEKCGGDFSSAVETYLNESKRNLIAGFLEWCEKESENTENKSEKQTENLEPLYKAVNLASCLCKGLKGDNGAKSIVYFSVDVINRLILQFLYSVEDEKTINKEVNKFGCEEKITIVRNDSDILVKMTRGENE